MSNEVFALLSAITGTIIGFILSEFSTLFRESRAKKNVASIGRKMLSMEINWNLSLLQRLQKELKEGIKLSENDENTEVDKGQTSIVRVILAPQSFNQNIYQNQLSSILIALRETEAIQVVSFYNRLNQLINTMETLRLSLEIVIPKEKKKPFTLLIIYTQQIQSLLSELVNEGSPIKG